MFVKNRLTTLSQHIEENSGIRKGTAAAEFLRFCARYFYLRFIKLKSVDEDSRRRESVLNVILGSSILLFGLVSTLVVYNRVHLGSNYKGFPVNIAVLLFCLFFGLFILSRIGKFVIASYCLLAIYFLTVTYSVYIWGPDLPSTLLGYVLVITISSLLISSRFAFFMTSLIGLILVVFSYMESGLLLSPHMQWEQQALGLNDGIGFAGILFVIMAISWLSNRETELSLRRARASEHALKDQRDHLEAMVAARTEQLEKEQAARLNQLYQFAEFGRMASGLFHDLINPLMSVSLYLERASQTAAVDINQTKVDIQRACDATKRVENFSRAIRKQLHQQQAPEIFSVGEGANQALQLLFHRACNMNVELSMKSRANINIYGNPIKFHQLMVNLIGNAIDSYADKPLQESEKPRQVKIQLEAPGNEMIISVQDWGAGIDPSILSKIFDQFFTTKAGKGMGIGLATVKEIVEDEFYGSIIVKSKVGKGTIFVVKLPFRYAPEELAQQQ